MRSLIPGIAIAAVLAAPAARADVEKTHGAGFKVRNAVEISAPPERVYAALAAIGRWWAPSHTHSGKSSNLTLVPEAGGCFCERLEDGGSVRHLTVVMAQTNRTLRLEGALGPLQAEGVSGALTFALEPRAKGTALVQTYAVGGMDPAGVETWSAPVDAVLRQQVERLKRYVETGSPDPTAIPKAGE